MPLQLTGDIDTDIESAFHYFQENINDRTHRPALFDKEVFIEAHETILDRPVGFWHLISLEENTALMSYHASTTRISISAMKTVLLV